MAGGDRQTDRRTEIVKKKKNRVELGLHFKVLGCYDCCSHLRGWLEEEEGGGTSGGRPIIICPTCCCDLVIPPPLFLSGSHILREAGGSWDGSGDEGGGE